MASRKEIQERCSALREDIYSSYKNGSLHAGMIIPSVRELALQFGLSKQVAHQEVQRMVGEGLLYSVPGSGTFVGTPPTRTDVFFVFIEESKNAAHPLHIGFAQRIAVLGGASLSFSVDEIRIGDKAHNLPPIAGVWDSTEGISENLPWGPTQRKIPRVGHIGHLEDPTFMDGVGVDDFEGGQQATAHLLRMGHRRIGFLGVHSGQSATPLHTAWSERREGGWRKILSEAHLPVDNLSFHPDASFAPPENWGKPWSLFEAAQSAARYLAARSDITAVVAANDEAAIAYVQTLHKLQVPVERWPALVGYDNLPNPKGQILSSLHRPLDKVGAAAADIIWNRYQSEVREPPIRQLIPMMLLPRITSESGWATRMPGAVSILLHSAI
jgi:hypothetical protein